MNFLLANNRMNYEDNPAMALFVACVYIGFYFIPTIIAAYRGHTNGIPIFLVNLFLGLTFLGWIVALVWACSDFAGYTKPLALLPVTEVSFRNENNNHNQSIVNANPSIVVNVDSKNKKKNKPLKKIKIEKEYNYQTEFELICGKRNQYKCNIEKEAILLIENNNPNDKTSVMVTVDCYCIGYLNKKHAIRLRKFLLKNGNPNASISCKCQITGGWYTNEKDNGIFEATLDLTPYKI